MPERTGGAGGRVGFDTLSAGRQEGLASTVRSVPRVCSRKAAGGSKGLRRQRVDPPAETGAPGVRDSLALYGHLMLEYVEWRLEFWMVHVWSHEAEDTVQSPMDAEDGWYRSGDTDSS